MEFAKRKAGRPKQYGTKTQIVSVTLPQGLLAALDATLPEDKKRSAAIVALLAQALNYDLAAN
jgi:metal-responsive CopG/Arc/MetJ family transcriptional regulator